MMKQVPRQAVNLTLIASTGFSILSVLLFLMYLLARFPLKASGSFTHNTLVVGIVVAGIAQFFQFLAVALILVAWFTLKALPKKRQEVIVLFLSLIPFVPVIILLVVTVLYLRALQLRQSPERRKELLEMQAGGVVDAMSSLVNQAQNMLPTGTNSPDVRTIGQVATAVPAGEPNVHAIIRNVVGPVTSDSLSKTPVTVLSALTVATVVASLSVVGVAATNGANSTKMTTHPSTGTVQTFTIPVSPQPLQSGPLIFGGMTVGPDGNFWIVQDNVSDIIRVTPTGKITTFPIPSFGATDITTGPDGNLWYIGPGRISPSGVLKTASFPAGHRITLGKDGNLWVTLGYYPGQDTAVARVTLTGSVKQFAFSKGIPGDIVSDAAGNLWFTTVGLSLGDATAIGKITLKGALTEFPMKGTGLNSGIIFGGDGNIWFTDARGIGRITPAGVLKIFPLSFKEMPSSVAWGPDGNVWFVSTAGIGRMTPTGTLKIFPAPVSDGTRLLRGPDGNLWFVNITLGGSIQLGHITP